MNKKNVAYRLSTGLVSFMTLGAGIFYFVGFETVAEMFTSLGYPTFIIYPLAVAKISAVVAIVSNKSKMLSTWAYAGLAYVFIFAVYSHIMVGDGQFGGALVALALLATSYKTKSAR